jgi:arsenite methyltransferase
MSTDAIHDLIRERYAAAAVSVTTGEHRNPLTIINSCCSVASCAAETVSVDATFGAALYGNELAEVPADAIAASLGCGNPMAVAGLRAGERVLDLGSGGGIDVLLSARRVGPTGFAFGVDMTDEMLDLARANAVKAHATNVDFLKGTIENVPLPDSAVDVVISNCVVNLSPDKTQVLAEIFRVLKPGGRVCISDVVAEDHLSPFERAERGSYVACIAGALSRDEYLDGLTAAGFVGAEVAFTHVVAPGMHGATISAIKPSVCCDASAQQSCCAPSEKAKCCAAQSEEISSGCACQ